VDTEEIISIDIERHNYISKYIYMYEVASLDEISNLENWNESKNAIEQLRSEF
jgi:hypothetical protein